MRAAPTSVPIEPGLVSWPSDDPRLIGGVCARCGSVAFPRPRSCARCTGQEIDEKALSPTGTLWSWTIQRFAPKPPFVATGPFVPYGVGYVDLAGEVIVESRLTTADPAQLEIGQGMQMVLLPFATRDGVEVLTFAFRPAAGTGR